MEPEWQANHDDVVAREAIAKKISTQLGSSCQRILLIQPLVLDERSLDIGVALHARYYACPPYGIGVLSSNLKKRGYTVHIEDINYRVLAFINKKNDPNMAVAELTTFWQSELQNMIETWQPNLIGLSCMYSISHGITGRTAAFIKSVNPNIPLMLGGVHATNSMETVLQDMPDIDFVGMFEWDVTFADMLDFSRGLCGIDKLSQIGTRINGTTVALRERHPPMADEIQEQPDYGDLPIGEYSKVGQIGLGSFWYGRNVRAGSMLANRGCRAHCSFCSTRAFNGPGVRQRRVNSVVDEMATLKNRYGITQITWLDDDLFFNVKHCMAIFNEIVQRNLGMTWDAFNGVIASAVVAHPELIAGSAASGCIGLMFGIESGSSRILKAVHKPSGLHHYRKLRELMAGYPQIFTKGFLMLGFPGETIAEIKQTINLAQEMRLDWYSVQVVSPLPMTEMYNQYSGPDGKNRGTMHGWTREVDRQKRIEREGGEQFFRLFEASDDHVPTARELYHLWFEVDFLVNYPKILDETNPAILDKSRRFLTEVCDNRVGYNAVTSLFLAIINKKLGLEQEAQRRRALAQQYFEQNDYWKTRLNGLHMDVHALLDRCRTDPAVIN